MGAAMYGDDVDVLPPALDEQPWLKEIIGAAGLPDRVDREGAAMVLGRLIGRPVSPETIRRWPIPYKVIAGCASYEVRDLIAHARAQYENAPRRIGQRSLVRHDASPSCLTQADLDKQRERNDGPHEKRARANVGA